MVVHDGKLAGIVSLRMLRYLPRSEWGRTPLARVLRQNTPYADSGELIEDSLQRMTENSLTVLPVKDDDTGEFTGSISSHEVMELIISAAKEAVDPSRGLMARPRAKVYRGDPDELPRRHVGHVDPFA